MFALLPTPPRTVLGPKRLAINQYIVLPPSVSVSVSVSTLYSSTISLTTLLPQLDKSTHSASLAFPLSCNQWWFVLSSSILAEVHYQKIHHNDEIRADTSPKIYGFVLSNIEISDGLCMLQPLGKPLGLRVHLL